MNGGRRRGRLCELPQIPIALKNESRFCCQREASVDNAPPGKVQRCSAVVNLPRNAGATWHPAVQSLTIRVSSSDRSWRLASITRSLPVSCQVYPHFWQQMQDGVPRASQRDPTPMTLLSPVSGAN